MITAQILSFLITHIHFLLLSMCGWDWDGVQEHFCAFLSGILQLELVTPRCRMGFLYTVFLRTCTNEQVNCPLICGKPIPNHYLLPLPSPSHNFKETHLFLIIQIKFCRSNMSHFPEKWNQINQMICLINAHRKTRDLWDRPDYHSTTIYDMKKLCIFNNKTCKEILIFRIHRIRNRQDWISVNRQLSEKNFLN